MQRVQALQPFQPLQRVEPLARDTILATGPNYSKYSCKKTIHFSIRRVKLLIFLQENHTFWYSTRQNLNIPVGKPYILVSETSKA